MLAGNTHLPYISPNWAPYQRTWSRGCCALSTQTHPAARHYSCRMLHLKRHPPRTAPAPAQAEYSATTRLPQKLVARIQNLEFVKVGELLPEAWIPEPQDTSSISRWPAQCAPVCNILVRTKCNSLMAAVLAEKHPRKAPHLLAYLKHIVHAARNFHGTTWWPMI